MQISKKLRSVEGKYLHYWCDGCKTLHGITYGPDGWSWNGDVNKPTFSPSVLVRYPANPLASDEKWRKERVCHTFITNGEVQYLSDCTHHLKGQTVLLPDLPEFHRDPDFQN